METKQMYAQVIDGSIVHRGGLPRNTKNVSGFNLQTDAELKAIGWLPMTVNAPTLGVNEVEDGEDVVIGSDDVTITVNKRTLSAQEIADRAQAVEDAKTARAASIFNDDQFVAFIKVCADQFGMTGPQMKAAIRAKL